MRIEQVELRIVRLPLVRPFQTSSSRRTTSTTSSCGSSPTASTGWGECASPSDPYYCPETTETCWHILRDFLAPLVLGREWSTIEELVGFYGRVKGNRFARAGLEMACWDLLARTLAQPLHSLLGRQPHRDPFRRQPGNRDRRRNPAGTDRPLPRRRLPAHQAQDRARAGMSTSSAGSATAIPAIALQVDANSAYTLDDLPTLKALDEFGLLLIEQPLADDDIIDHARLQESLKTPICLDESIHSVADARKALDLGACRVINIKVSRLGGLLEAEARSRSLLRARSASLVRRNARVRHRPGGQRRDRLAAGLHHSRRCLGLRQVLRRRHRRTADPGATGSDRGFQRPRPRCRADEERIRARTLREFLLST